ncbi:cytochrome C peroxidase [Telmatocola sphagniphila]|uniref:Cytochrome C peroxidase n=1 Tax=Telmatocola sphagniphila TaxID=1123043 RepID=A0A8E6EU57_9BACT|nr:cytochrome c peroxidase [Telmatocola sphagniphila]QVL30970.1 cytochrome C peroxidase [Telmatocola sphagniphila]
MKSLPFKRLFATLGSLGLVVGLTVTLSQIRAAEENNYDYLLPDITKMKPLEDQIPVSFVSRSSNRAEWEKLPGYWNEVPGANGKKVVKIKLPLGINLLPPVPIENPITVAKWKLGKEVFFDKVISSDNSVSCSSCHEPSKGYSDMRKTSLGIAGNIGGMNAPTVFNSVYNRFMFWDGRMDTLEAQAHGPIGNPSEMFDGKGKALHEAVKRIRLKGDYSKRFEEVFGALPTVDSIAKAIATYERLVIIGNSLVDRAEVAMRARVEEEEGNKFEVNAKDYEKVLKEAVAKKDTNSLEAIGFDPAKDVAKIPQIAASINNGRVLFFNKARCNSCHVGENFTDYTFHNLGVGAKNGKLLEGQEGRINSQPTGHKDPSMMGAFKTPPLRGLTKSRPYLHDGSEATLEAVIDFYDRGGNVNEFLDSKMRDTQAEQAYLDAAKSGKPYTGPKPELITKSGLPIIPFKLNLTPQEKADLVLYLKALEGEALDPIVADPAK